jgi:hypothetical protein
MCVLVFCSAFALAVEYKGKWTSAHSGGSGEIRLKLDPDSDVVFTYQGSEVKAKVAKSSIEGAAVELEFHFRIDGNELKSVYKATKSDGKLTGKYVTSVRGEGTPVDGGSIDVAESN